MSPQQPRKGLFDGRGLLLVDDFCRASGLDRPEVQALVEAGLLEDAVDQEAKVVGLWDDALPTSDQLRQMGFAVSNGYAPDLLRSTTDHDLEDEDGDDADADEDEDGSTSTWAIFW